MCDLPKLDSIIDIKKPFLYGNFTGSHGTAFNHIVRDVHFVDIDIHCSNQIYVLGFHLLRCAAVMYYAQYQVYNKWVIVKGFISKLIIPCNNY